MADTLQLEVVTPEKTVISEKVRIVTAPGSEGEFGVLAGHTPFLTALKIGVLTFKDEAGAEHKVFVNNGFAETLPNQVTILAESSERQGDIDMERAKRAMERAQRRLESKEAQIDFARAKAALMRAQIRLSIAETRMRREMQ